MSLPFLSYSQLYGQQLCHLTNEYRNSLGISSLILSYTMNTIAEIHVNNLINNKHDILNTNCNLHSWYSETVYNSNLQYCCYPSNPCMSSKGREITSHWGVVYTGNVAENSFANAGSGFGAFLYPE